MAIRDALPLMSRVCQRDDFLLAFLLPQQFMHATEGLATLSIHEPAPCPKELNVMVVSFREVEHAGRPFWGYIAPYAAGFLSAPPDMWKQCRKRADWGALLYGGANLADVINDLEVEEADELVVGSYHEGDNSNELISFLVKRKHRIESPSGEVSYMKGQ